MDSLSDLTSHTIGCQADVHRMWEVLMGPLGFARRCAWVVLVGRERRPSPRLVKIDEMPDDPADFSTDGFYQVFGALLDDAAPDGSLALLLCRPGTCGIDKVDRMLAQAFLDGARRAGVRLEPMHLATDRELVAITPDDLAA